MGGFCRLPQPQVRLAKSSLSVVAYLLYHIERSTVAAFCIHVFLPIFGMDGEKTHGSIQLPRFRPRNLFSGSSIRFLKCHTYRVSFGSHVPCYVVRFSWQRPNGTRNTQHAIRKSGWSVQLLKMGSSVGPSRQSPMNWISGSSRMPN